MEKQPQSTSSDHPLSGLQTEMSVYYGSQTGTAAGFAKTLAEEAVQYGVKAKVVDLATFDPSVLSKEKLAIVIIATYGRGGPTDNAKKFYQWLISPTETKPDSLKDTMFAVFGCGDRGFKFFNKMATDVTEKFLARGGKKIHETGLGDASEDIEGDFATWKSGLWDAIRSHCKATHDLDKSVCIQPDFAATFDEKEVEAMDFSNVEFDLTTKQYMEAKDFKILRMRQMRSSTDEGSTLMLELDNKAAGVTYETAATFAVFPINDQEVVERLATSQGWELDRKFVLRPKEGSSIPYPFPGPITVREALSKFCDLTGLLLYFYYEVNALNRKGQLKKLANYSKYPDNIEEYAKNYEHFKEQYKSIVDVIVEHGIKIPFGDFVGICNRMIPRYYTISSSAKANPDRLRLTIAVVQRQVGTTIKKGLCTGYIEKIYANYFEGENPTTPFYLRAFTKGSLFNTPSSDTVPIIMIGPGCGVAPFIGYIEEREYKMNTNKDTKYGPMELYFGCRRREKDFIYAKELQQWKEKGVLTGLHLAFSREQKHKIYVQDLIKRDREVLHKYIKEQGAIVHVCGSLIMGEGIRKAILDVLSVGEANPEAYLEVLEKSGRLVAELWG